MAPHTGTEVVRYYTKNGGWRFGHLIESGYKWALVRTGDGVKRVPVAEVKPWPPEPREAAPETPRRVKRGGVK